MTDQATADQLAAKREAGEKFVYWACYQQDRLTRTGSDWVLPNEEDPGALPVFEAAARDVPLPAPVARMWPDPNKQVVNIETWLHVDSDMNDVPIPFRPSSYAANVSTTNVLTSATATATGVQWTFGGDAKGTPENPVRCPDAGRVWGSGAKDTNCSVRFYKAGSGTATVTITYDVFWVSTTGAWGIVRGVERSATVDYQVKSYQAVIR